MIVLSWLLNGFLILLMVVGGIGFFNFVLKTILGIDEWSDLRKHQEEPAADQTTFTFHTTIHFDQGETKI